jgi:hypothetical protein
MKKIFAKIKYKKSQIDHSQGTPFIFLLNKFAFVFLFIFLFSFFLNPIFVSAVDTTPPTVDMTYSLNPMGVGARTITASYSEEVVGTPTISIDQPGTTDIVNATMTSASPGSIWTARDVNSGNSWNSVTYGNNLFVAVASYGDDRIMTSPDGISWTARTAPEENSWKSVTYGNGLFVAVASTGTNRVMTSPDGITWSARTATQANLWQGVTYGNGLFVAVSSDGTNRVMTSPDGITWTARIAAEATSWYSVTYGNNLFVAVSPNGTNKAMTSPDGITWTGRFVSNAGNWISVTYGNNLFVAVSSYISSNIAVITSPDGITWTTRTVPESNDWRVTYGNGIFVAVGQSGTNRIMTSSDSITWTVRTATEANTWMSVAYGDGKFVAVASNGTKAVMTSPFSTYTYSYIVNQADGSNYIDGTATVSLSSVTDLALNPSTTPTHNTFVIDTVAPTVALSYSANPSGVGIETITATYSKLIATIPNISINQQGTTDITNISMVSPGGIWTARTTATSLYDVAYGNGLFVAVGGGGVVTTSPDGITWTAGTPANGSNWYSVTYGNGLFVAVASSGGTNRVMTSPDGITWTGRTAAQANSWYSVTYGNGLFVAVSSDGTNRVMTSPDGITWTARIAAEANDWMNVTYGNGLFVAVSQYAGANKIMTSPDGITWTARKAPIINYWRDVIYGNGLFVAVGTNSTYFMTSLDGITWITRIGVMANSVTYGNGLFVAVSSYGTNRVMTSPDGITWTARTAAEANSWYGVTYGNGLFVAVSYDGTNRVMTSPANFWTYDYIVNKANSTTYIDGTATVSLSSVTDFSGNPASAPTNTSFTIDTTGPTVALTYTANPVKAGVNTITATYSEAVTSTPKISINQQGTTDITNTNMSGSGTVWTYDYTVNTANGTTYLDGTASVSLSAVASASGALSAPPTNTSFIIDTTAPTLTYTYTSNPIKAGTQTITATYSEPVTAVPTISINQPGTTDVIGASMTNTQGVTWIGGGSPTFLTSITYGNGLFVGVGNTGTNRVATSLDGVTWTARTAAEANSWYSVTYGNGLFVAVSSDGTNRVMTSPDGITWTARIAAEATSWYSVTYDNGLFVAVAGNGINRVMISTDGITWTARTAAEANAWKSVTYGNGLFVAVATSGTNRVMTSPDGITWTGRTAAEANSWQSITYGNGMFVAVASNGTNQVMTSPDGITWTARMVAGVNNWIAVTYGNGLFVSIDNNGLKKVMVSTDGINWIYNNISQSGNWYSIIYAKGRFVVGGNSVCMYSSSFTYSYTYTVNQSDGTNYIDGRAIVSIPSTTDLVGNVLATPTTDTFVIDTTGPLVDLLYSRNPSGTGVNTITALYSESIATAPTISINQPGTTDITNQAMVTPASVWTARTAASASGWLSVTYGNGLFVAVAISGTNKVMTSPDGITWTLRTSVIDGAQPQSVTYGNGLFVAVVNNFVATSPDGITWTARTAAEANSWYGVTYGNGLFVAVATSGTNRVMTSADGVTWTGRTAAQANSWVGVTYGNGLFVAVASSGTNLVMTSPDGITWTARPVTNTWKSVTYGNGLFVAVGLSGWSTTSPDGINWTNRYNLYSGLSTNWYSVTYSNGLFVAVSVPYSAGNKQVATSSDGITWTARTEAQANSWQSVTYGNGKFVAVSSDGTNRVMTSPAGYSYDYTVNTTNGSTYIDGTALVSLSSVNDIAGNQSQSPTNASFEINTVPPTVAMTYSKSPVGVGAMTITATYSKSITSAPNISINQPGTTDISAQPMTGSGKVYTYSYTVNTSNGYTYIDGTASITLSNVVDDSGFTADAPTNATFLIETVPPTATISYSPERPLKTGDELIITATFSEPMADSPAPQISITGSNILALTNMTKVDATHYTYTHIVGTGDSVSAVALGTGTDLATNIVDPNISVGGAFILDNEIPTVGINAVCGIGSNGCTISGALSDPQQPYSVQTISGVSSDARGTGIDNVKISINDLDTGKWYDGTAFTSDTAVYLPATGTEIWSFDFSLVPLIIDHEYTITAKAEDMALNPITTSVTIKFTNAPPVVTNVTASEDATGLISVTYDVTDIESTETTNYLFYGLNTTLNGSIADTDTSISLIDGVSLPLTGFIMIDDEIISYTTKVSNTISGLTRGAMFTTPSSHTTGASIYMYAPSATGTGIGLSDKGTGKIISWQANDDANGFENANGVIRVVANDGSAGSMIGSLDSSPFHLDASAPLSTITFDAGIAGTAGSARITIPLPNDTSAVEYRIIDDVSQTNAMDTDWVMMSGNVTIPWSFDSDIEIKTLRYQFRDSYGNESALQTVSTHMPVASGSFMVQDTSNVTANPKYYDLYIGWQATNADEFDSYLLEQATSSDGETYSAYTAINGSGFSDVATNYYVYRNLDPDLWYRFRLAVVDTNGNISVRSNSYTTTKPDGIQNYGEGGGGSVLTAPKVENVVVIQNLDKTVTVNYKVTDLSLGKKVNPSYEAYVFYDTGITLPTNALSGNTLTLSDASKLRSVGYIQINNEIIKYIGKIGNTLTGIVRGTWSDMISSGRATRSNMTFFAGTPVWVMANGTGGTVITDNTILSGQDEMITWDTYYESSLAGDSYSNVGIKVLVHDNQDVLTGPLSSQNDYSENGVINTLDLNAPTIEFDTAMSSGDESVTPVSIGLTLSRHYPLPVSVDYTIGGTTTNGDDYIFTDGTVSIATGNTTAMIEIPITDDILKEIDETIIVTLGNPTNASLGTNTTYTYTIIDNDIVSGIQFTDTSSSGLENINQVEIPLTLAVVSGADTTVDYTITGTAINGDDYTLSDGTITIPKGEIATNITLPIIDDTFVEESETIIITLSNPTNATLGINTTYTYTILDNDLFPTLEFVNPTSENNENVGTVQIPVSISSPYPEDITFSYAVSGGTAEGNMADYLLDQGTGIIIKGETETKISLVINDDELSEETETIIITLSNPTNAILGAGVNTIHSIIDNEIPVKNVSSSEIKSTSARIIWTTADYTDSLVEYGTIAPPGTETEIPYTLSKSNSEKTLEHDVYIGNLTPITTYYYRLTSKNLADEITISESSFTTTSGPIISAVSYSDITDTTAIVTWTTDIPTTSYVNYSTDQNLLTPTRTGIVDLVTTHSVPLTNLDSDSVYYFSVDGTDIDNNSGEDRNDGVYYTFTTGRDQTPPVISEIDTPIITDTQFVVVWITNEPADGKIMYGTVSNPIDKTYDNESELIIKPLTNHLTAISELDEKTTYYYVIVSKDENGNETISEEQTVITEKVVVKRSSSGMVGVAQELYNILLAENEANKAKLKNLDDNIPVVSGVKVSDVTAFGATISFETSENTVAFIEYGKDSTYGKTEASSDWAKTHQISLTGLSLGTDYYFKIKAMDKSNDTGYSEEQNFKTKFFSENLDELKKIENVEQFQAEIESTIESILPSLVPPFIEKPVFSDITESSAVVTFRTNIKAYPIVSYGPDNLYDATKENPYIGEMSDTTEKSLVHTLSLINLKPNTTYHVMVKAFSLPQVVGKSEDYTFTTSSSKIQGSIIDVKKDSFTVVWNTDEPTSSIVEYKNLKTGRISRIVDDAKNSSHSTKIENLSPGTIYEVTISGINEKGNLVEGGAMISVKTSTDNIPPVISNIKVDSALVVGRTDKVQTIISWTTDEPSTSTVYYEEGSGSPDKSLANKQEDTELTKNHVVILSSLKPGTVYRFTVESMDGANNTSKPPIRTIITPKKTESIVDVIFKNFDETFQFINNVR